MDCFSARAIVLGRETIFINPLFYIHVSLDVEQMMDSGIHGNDEARDWAKSIFCHALDSKYRYRAGGFNMR